ncbi:MAG: TerC/Alx family metal homeostasis membrane protein [Bacteroidota bacterium]
MIQLFSLFRSQSQTETILFGVFALVILVFLLLDLGLFNKEPKAIDTRSALKQSIFWVSVSTVFGILVYFFDERGADGSLEYFSAYLTEYALSVDNIFVILLILKYFSVKEEYYHKILFWGILGALVFRGVFIFVGALLVAKFHWILYLFGAFLVYSGIKIYFNDQEDEMDPGTNPILKLCKRWLPVSHDDGGGQFTLRENGKLMFTPLFLVVVLIETTDLVFAVDSIPAAFAISQSEFIIYTSNIFAVLGLRAMFFLLSGVIDRFYLLQKGLSIILFFIGAKMLVELGAGRLPDWLVHLHPGISFGFIILTLALSIIFSVIIPEVREQKELEEKSGEE